MTTDALHDQKLSRGWCMVLIAGFVSTIWLPLLGSFFKCDPSAYVSENRVLASCPSFHLKTIATFPSAFEAFYRDHVGFRNTLLRGWNTVMRKWLRISSDAVLIGKNKWLYHASEGCIDDYMGGRLLPRQHLVAMRNSLEQKKAWLAARGIKFLFVIVPDKQSVYPEYLPDYIRAHAGLTRREQFVDFMRHNSTVDVLDVTNALLQAKGRHRLYYYGDPHWTAWGKFIGCQEMCRYISRWLPGVQLCGEDYFNVLARPERGILINEFGLTSWAGVPRDLLVPRKGMLKSRTVDYDVPAGFPHVAGWGVGGWMKPVVTDCPDAKGRVLVFADSFMSGNLDGWALTPLRESFERLILIQVRPDPSYWLRSDYRSYEIMINQEHPDVVVEEYIERHLGGAVSLMAWGAAAWKPVQDPSVTPGAQVTPSAG